MTIKNHFPCIERIITEHRIEAARIPNFDESRLIADNDNVRTSRSKCIALSKTGPEPR